MDGRGFPKPLVAGANTLRCTETGGTLYVDLDVTVDVDGGERSVAVGGDRPGVEKVAGCDDWRCARPRGVPCWTNLCMVADRLLHSFTCKLDACKAAFQMSLVT